MSAKYFPNLPWAFKANMVVCFCATVLSLLLGWITGNFYNVAVVIGIWFFLCGLVLVPRFIKDNWG